ncbi:hypothetical protein GCK72_015557 [Caenorhabditis remanei]|uniref:F-box domain-containing protein n=1 Tax=Caenorhabditis remanei TaxID=31234 RepID=A0A6A5GWV3_CAERE|nr:hypothetical protein GCK72_015557 [Caenorhabditis remanei]KAF1759096.1 hypothetical protein GCK72_015557 [Caenorhabditis remanei]
MTFLFSLFRLLSWIISVFFQTIKSLLVLNGLLPPPPFPIFRVPYLPLARIIDFMEPEALVSLSLCSRKSHSVIKTQRRAPFNGRIRVSWPHRDVMFYSVKNLTRVLRAANYSYFPKSERSNYVKMNGQNVPVIMHPLDGFLVSGWENITEGLETITDYVTNLFNIDISEVFVSDDSFKMIEWVNSRQTTPLKKIVYMAMAWSPCSSEDEMNYILRDCRCSSEIRIHSKAPSSFRFSGNFRRIDCLDISNSEWVTIDNLLTMDGIDIHLDNASLSNSDLNVFLKHWLSGGCPRLKLFCARIGSVDIFRVLAGLRHNVVRVENRRDYNSPFGHQWTLWDGYDIQRADGVTATVHYEPVGALVIAVWPETTHNYN